MDALRLALYIAIINLCFGDDTVYIRCYKSSIHEYDQVALSNAPKILQSDCYEDKRSTVFYTFGYRGNLTGYYVQLIISELLLTGENNVMAIDWSSLASSGDYGIARGYLTRAAPNSIKVGVAFGNALVDLHKTGLDLNRTHLIGHSLGAQLTGNAGRQLIEKGFTVAKITGLDPARPAFEGAAATRSRLQRGCARRVVLLHTDPGGYGYRDAHGDVDYWPNDPRGKQIGCPTGSHPSFSLDDLCSHIRAILYLCESLRNPGSLVASSAKNYRQWLNFSDLQRREHTSVLGAENDDATGNYYFTTGLKPPFGLGLRGLYPSTYVGDIRKPEDSLFEK